MKGQFVFGTPSETEFMNDGFSMTTRPIHSPKTEHV